MVELKKMTGKLTIFAALVTGAALALTGCGNGGEDPDATKAPEISKELAAKLENTIDATITLEDGDEINLELYPDLAPETVDNFVELAEDGFYDGLIFHRVIEGFMIQGGGYDEDLNEKKADKITGEFESNGFENELSHTRGVVSMARVGNDPNSASSQFFIMHGDADYLDGEYAAFGRVKDDMSMTVVDDIAAVTTGSVMSKGFEDVPVTPIVIKSVTIEGGGASNSPASRSDKKASPDPDRQADDIDETDAPEDMGELTDEELQEILDSFDDRIDSSGSSNTSGGSGSSGSSSTSGSAGSSGSSGTSGRSSTSGSSGTSGGSI